MSISPHAALIYTMIVASACDNNITDAELALVGDIVGHLPVFRGYDLKQLPATATSCADILSAPDGANTLLHLIHQSLPRELFLTAYVLATDVVYADGVLSDKEADMLALLQKLFSIDALTASACEKASMARFIHF